MKSLTNFLNESISDLFEGKDFENIEVIENSQKLYDKNPKYFREIADFKDGENIIVGWIDEDGEAFPFNVIVNGKEDSPRFMDPDDDENEISINELIHTETNKGDIIAVAWAKTPNQMQKICDEFNKL